MKKLSGFIVLLIALFLGGVIGWWIKALDGIGYNYIEETLMNQSENIEKLEEYIIQRRDYETDIDAFEQLNLIFNNQHDGKYAPWLNTKLGLVRFDDLGYIDKICYLPSGLNDPDCPSSL